MFPFHTGSAVSFQISDYLENNDTTSNSNKNDNYSYNSSNVVYFDSTGVEQNASAPRTTHLHNPPAAQHRQRGSNGAKRGRPRGQAPSMEVSNNEDQGANDIAQRRIMHREIERQRRHEMANLFSSLRNILPAEYIRGKRSTSDHLTEAAKYIKDLEKNINELQQKKEKLKSSSSCMSGNNVCGDVECSSSSGTGSSSTIRDCNVSIHSFPGAIDVEINAGVGFPLSRVFHVLIQQGLNVLDCASSKVNQRWIYVIHCEAKDEILVDSTQLRQRLMSVIGSSNEQ